MSLKITNNLGLASLKASQGAKAESVQDKAAAKAQSFDSAVFAARPTGEEAFVRDTAADIVQKAHVRPTKSELNSLRFEIEKGNYQIDSQELAKSILLLGEEE